MNKQSKAVALACPNCGSFHITRDATAAWSAAEQCWDIAGTQDCMTCQACGREFYEAAERTVNATLFNCCAESAEPDWALYDALEVNCCRDDGGATSTCCLHEADFFTVYGRLKAGGVEAITDCSTRTLALVIALVLSEHVDMAPPVVDYCRDQN
ncbi:MAG: hypothetical protein WDM91_10800 [Rhizomicrobium sp.]